MMVESNSVNPQFKLSDILQTRKFNKKQEMLINILRGKTILFSRAQLCPEPRTSSRTLSSFQKKMFFKQWVLMFQVADE